MAGSLRSSRPLAGVEVLDVGTYIAGPLAATHLAHLGANVTCVRRPPNARGAAQEALYRPHMHAALTRGKRVVTLDLPVERDRFVSLLKTADVIITNYPASCAARLGVDAQSCSRVRPEIIHIWMPGFASADDQLVTAPPDAWEAVVMASAGVFRDMGVNRRLLGIAASFSPLPLASTYASVWAALAACAALFRSARLGTQLGESIEVPLASSLLETLCHNSLHLEGVPEHYLSARVRRLAADEAARLGSDGGQKHNSRHTLDMRNDSDGTNEAGSLHHDYYDVQELLDPFYASYMCRDARPFYLVCPSHRAHQERAIDVLGIRERVRALGVPVAKTYDAAPDATCAQMPAGSVDSVAASASQHDNERHERWHEQRHGLGAGQVGDAHAAALRKLLRAAFLTRTAYEWEQRLGAAGVPCAAHRSTSEWLESEHARVSGLVVPDSSAGDGAVHPGPIAWVFEGPPPLTSAAVSPTPVAEPTVEAASRTATPSNPAGQPPTAVRRPWLDGVRVLDLANVIAGPTIGALLARFGADVIKVDPTVPTYAPDTTVVYGLAANVGKRSILLNINDDEPRGGRSAFSALVARADVLVANATSASLDRLRCSPSELAQLNPELVLCRFDAWGGPNEGAGARATHLGYDDNIQAALGIMERFGGGLGRVEEHAHIGTVDVIAGVGGALATVAGLYYREARRRDSMSVETSCGAPSGRISPHVSSASMSGLEPHASSTAPSGLIVARASLASLGQIVQLPFCCGVPSQLAAEAATATTAQGPLCRGEHALLRCYEASDGEWLLLHASLHPCAGAASPEARQALERLASAHPALRQAVDSVCGQGSARGSAQGPPSSDDELEEDLSASLTTAFRASNMPAGEWVARLRSHGVVSVKLCSLSNLRGKHSTSELQLHGSTFQFLTDHHHPAGSAVTYFAPLAVRPWLTPLVAPLPSAPKYGAHTRQVLVEAAIDADALIRRGAASESWSEAYLPGPIPTAPPQLGSPEAQVAPNAEAAQQRIAARAIDRLQRCPVCLEAIVRRVELSCSHSLCASCAAKCGEAGHRRCPVCRVPHLLHPEKLAERSNAWRKSYAAWRVGKHSGAHGEVSSIRTPTLKVDAAVGLTHTLSCGDLHLATAMRITKKRPRPDGICPSGVSPMERAPQHDEPMKRPKARAVGRQVEAAGGNANTQYQ